MLKKIVITGGPGTGKTSLISYLQNEGYSCMPEISREVIIEAKKKGIDQLFLKDPILFSTKLLEGRLLQYQSLQHIEQDFLFYDRGLPDITAYLDYIQIDYPIFFKETCENYKYDIVFLLPPWKGIYKQDNERYETYEEAKSLHKYLVEGYKKYSYNVIEIPHGSLKKRKEFVFNTLNNIF